MKPVPDPHGPMPRSLLALAAVIAAIEVILSLADQGWIADPSLRSRALCAGAFWSQLGPEAPFARLCGAPAGHLFALQPVTMFVTHAFLHGSLLHMVMNMTILLAIGRFVGDRYGAGTVLPEFLLSAIAGGAAFKLMASPAYPMVGASGAVFGFLGVWIVWDWRRHQRAHRSTGPVLRRVLVLAGINVVLYFGLGGMLAWQAHLGGFLAGLLIGVWLENRLAGAWLAERRRARGERDPRA
jgi:membrane associated rhomboid family serine protease